MEDEGHDGNDDVGSVKGFVDTDEDRRQHERQSPPQDAHFCSDLNC